MLNGKKHSGQKNEGADHLTYSRIFEMWEQSEKSRHSLIDIIKTLTEANKKLAETNAELNLQKVKS